MHDRTGWEGRSEVMLIHEVGEQLLNGVKVFYVISRTCIEVNEAGECFRIHGSISVAFNP